MTIRLNRAVHSTDCENCPIRYRAVCARCDAEELEQLESMKSYRAYAAGQAIQEMGQPLDFVASVVSGCATLSQTLSDGRVQMTGLLLPSDFIGRPDRATAAFDVTAVEDVVLCCFERKAFGRLISNTPHVGQRLLEMTLDELDVAREWMLLLGRKSAREKVASVLVILARRSAALKGGQLADGMAVDMPITRETLANYLGLTIETVSRQFSALKRDGIIVLEGSRIVRLPDLADLVTETGDDDTGLALL